MDFSKQKEWSAPVHQAALKEGGTCIDCHKGIAHKLPE
jgi:cytochrome c-type protein NapC